MARDSDPPARNGNPPKAKIFISYSRQDIAFADQLDAGLRARGFDPMIDRAEIYAFEDWWARIQSLIGGCDTVIFILSPQSTSSKICAREVEFAASLNKRFAPVVCEPVNGMNVPEALKRLNFIFFDDPAVFETNLDALVSALQTDIGWIRKHTQFGEAARHWVASGRAKGLLLRPPLLEEAEYWLKYRPETAPLPSTDTQSFVLESRTAETETKKAEATAQVRRRRMQTALYMLLVGIIIGLIGWINQSFIKERWNWYTTMRPYMVTHFRPYVLQSTAELKLKPGQSFKECAQDCPEMVVVPSGDFTMGASSQELLGADAVLLARALYSNAEPVHRVAILRPIAISKFLITFADWDACVSVGGCPWTSDNAMGRLRKPVVNVSWTEARQYANWLSNMTGHNYRLLSEAEWEYVARAGTQTFFYWGNEIGKGNANCVGCGSKWDGRETSPVGSFKPNKFGLYDMLGNVVQWTEDCYQDNYLGAPADGSPQLAGDCNFRVLRGGSWSHPPDTLRSSFRDKNFVDKRSDRVGFRVARILGP